MNSPPLKKNVVISKQVLAWGTLAEAQRTKTVTLDTLRETKDFYIVKSDRVGQKVKPTAKKIAQTKQKLLPPQYIYSLPRYVL